LRNSGDAQWRAAVSAPDLDSLRQQVGDAVFEARIAEARSREEILMRLEAATASGVSFQGAVQSLGILAAPSTLRRWSQRWRSFGLAGLPSSARRDHRGPHRAGSAGAAASRSTSPSLGGGRPPVNRRLETTRYGRGDTGAFDRELVSSPKPGSGSRNGTSLLTMSHGKISPTPGGLPGRPG